MPRQLRNVERGVTGGDEALQMQSRVGMERAGREGFLAVFRLRCWLCGSQAMA